VREQVWRGAVVLAALLAGCGGAPAAPAAVAVASPTLGPQPSAGAKQPAPAAEPLLPPQDDTGATRASSLVDAMLGRVARARGLPIVRPVQNKVLERDELGRRIREIVEHDTPKEEVAGQGELLAAFELVPADYDYVSGVFALLGSRVAGFYDPEDRTMYLAGDLDEEEANETLAHELAHALADQTFPLAPMTKYVAGDGDRLSAVHAVIEGDATSAMLDVTQGSALDVSDDVIRMAFFASTALSPVGGRTPKALLSSLVAPYVDGFALVQALRRQGGWPAVDAVWKAMPETTEQLLHLDKLRAHEPAIPIPVPALGKLGAKGYKAVIDDALGEQGLRIMLEDWTSRSEARAAAAGWGGDRFVVATQKASGAADRMEVAVAWHLRMDTARDANEVAAIVERRFGKECQARGALGPLSWRLSGADLVMVAGPYERRGLAATSQGTCAEARAWIDEVLKAAPVTP
jgi:hypothetical protein